MKLPSPCDRKGSVPSNNVFHRTRKKFPSDEVTHIRRTVDNRHDVSVKVYISSVLQLILGYAKSISFYSSCLVPFQCDKLIQTMFKILVPATFSFGYVLALLSSIAISISENNMKKYLFWNTFYFCLFFHVPAVICDHQSAPHFLKQPTFAGGVAPENNSLFLQCQADGIPPPEYQWLRNGKPLGNFSHDTYFRIHAIHKENSGQYQCVARNPAGTVISDKTSLTVAYIRQVSNSGTGVSLTVENGNAAILQSPSIESVPQPEVTWGKIGLNRLIGIQYATTLSNAFVILATKKADEGQYQASLINTHVGRDIRGDIVQLSVIGEDSDDVIPPVIIIPPSDSEFARGSYSDLECIANARPLELVQTLWKKDGEELHLTGLPYFLSNYNRSLALRSINPRHQGMYECEVSMRELDNTIVKAVANVTVLVQPVIDLAPEQETVSEIGRMLFLPCSASGYPTPSIKWYRNAVPVETTFGRFHIFPNGTLQIASLHVNDVGIYQCIASNKAGEASVSTWLHVKTSAPVLIKAPSNITVLDGKDAQIHCETAGAPSPNVTWTFNDSMEVYSSGRVQILDNGNLLIASVEPSDVGKYTCTRANNAGVVTGFGYLSVLVRTQIIQPPVDTQVILSSTAELLCRVSHDPTVPYKVQWYFGQKEIVPHDGGRIQILNDGSLRIGQARNTDVGTYTCYITSAGGNETRNARLDVIELPHPPNNVNATLLNNTVPKSVNVSWSKAFDGYSPITNYIVQMRVVPSDMQIEYLHPWTTAVANISGNQHYAILANLKPAASYEFRVSAVNGVGEGNPSSPTSVIHLPSEPPSGPPQGVVGSARSSTAITLQWQPPSEEDRNGDLFGYLIRYKLAGYVASPWAYHNVTEVAQHSFLLQDLIVWQNYEIQVAAYNEKGVGKYSESIYIRTHEGVPQSAPSDVKVEALNSTGAMVWWKPPDPQLINGINQGYKLQAWLEDIGTTGSPTHTVLVAPSTVDPLAEQHSVINNLSKFTTYRITVLCFTSPGDGPKSDPVLVTTKQDVPDKVSSLKFEDILDTSLKVIWGRPVRSNGILKAYTLKYHIKDAPETTAIRNVSADATNAVVTDLRPVTAYTFEIFAWTVIGPGPSRTATIQSGIPPVLPGPPSKLAVSNIGPFSVVLQFTPGFDGNSSIIKWTVESQTRRDDSWIKIYEASDPDATNLQVYNLVPFTEYCLRLSATNVVGSSEPSEPSKFFQTIQAPPSHPPYNVTVRAVSATALRVRWTPLRQAEWYGIPRGYNIQYREIFEGEDPLANHTYQSVILEDHNAYSFVLKGLEEFTDFMVFVQAFNDVGSSAPSPTAVEKTRESVPSAGPQNVKINATSSTTIVVKWGEVPSSHQNGVIEGYKVYYGAKVVPFRYHKIESNSTFTTTLTELRKYTLYSVQVLAFSRIGDGVLSVPPVSGRTFEDVPGMPSNVSFPDVTTTTARILWDVPTEPSGIILAYRISYHLKEATDRAITKELAPTERTYKAVNLEPEMYYLFSASAQTNEGWGKMARALVFTTNNREAPQAPTIPHISKSQIQARQITFSWTPGRDGFAPLRYYTVQVAEGDDSPWKTAEMKVDPMVSTYTVTELKPFTPYKFRIRATNDIGASGWSPESNIAMTLPAAPEKAPPHVMVTPYTTTSVRVSWEMLSVPDWNGDMNSAGYRVEYCQVASYTITRNGDCPSEKTYGRNLTVLSLHELEQDRMYEIKVYAFNKEGDGPPSRPVPVFVGEAVPTGEPQDVRAEEKSSSEIQVSWRPPHVALQNGDLLGYKIFYEPRNGKGIEEMEAVPNGTSSYVLLDLKKYTEYSIQVLAFNPAGDGPRSLVVHARTMEDIPGSPGSLVFSDITMTSLNVSWSVPAEPNGQITGYSVIYETALPEIDVSKQVKQKVTTTYLSVHGLAETVTYTFRVRAETFNYGPEAVKNVTTGPQEGSPSSPEDLMLKHTHTSVTLQWKNGAEGGSPITGYLIELRQTGGTDPWQPLVLLNNNVQTSYTISFTSLLLSTSYQFRLFARNFYGISYPILSPQPFATPSKLYLEHQHKLPVYREVWFLVMLAAVSVVIIILVVAVLCVKSKVYKYKKETQKSYHADHVSMDDGGFATFELCQSKRGTLCKNTLSRKNNNAVLTKSPPRPSPGSVTYSDDEDVKGYDENCDSSSLTEKPSEMSSSDSQGSDSERESDGKSDPHSFVNHYANVNDTLRQSWKRQRPVKPPSYTDSEPEGSIQVSLNGGQIIMNNMAGSRAPLPGFSSFV